MQQTLPHKQPQQIQFLPQYQTGTNFFFLLEELLKILCFLFHWQTDFVQEEELQDKQQTSCSFAKIHIASYCSAPVLKFLHIVLHRKYKAQKCGDHADKQGIAENICPFGIPFTQRGHTIL